MADLTAAQILEVVVEFHKGEGATINRALYLTLLNRALDEISDATGGFDTHWNNDSDDDDYGTLELSDADVTFPSDLIDFDPHGVRWNGKQLAVTSIDRLDQGSEGWRSATGTPSAYARTARGIVLDVMPDGTTDAMLVIYGKGIIPHIADGEGSIAYLGQHLQLLLADYIIAYLPIDYRNKSDAAIASMERERQRALGRWEGRLKNIAYSIKKRTLNPLGVEVI